MMAVARIPFLGDNRRSTYQCIINGVYKQPSFLSDSLCHLISTMLETTVSSRATLSQVAVHPWVTDQAFLGKRPTDLMWYEDTNTCSSEYETSLRTSDFEKFGLDHDRGLGSQQTCTHMSFSDIGVSLTPRPSQVQHVSQGGENVLMEEEMGGRFDEKGKGKEKEEKEEGKEKGKEVLEDTKDKERKVSIGRTSTGSASDGGSLGSNDRTHEQGSGELSEERGGMRRKNSKGKGQKEEKSKKPKRRKIRTESVESRVDSIRRAENVNSLSVKRGGSDQDSMSVKRDESAEENLGKSGGGSGSSTDFPNDCDNFYNNANSEEINTSFFSNHSLFSKEEEQVCANRVSLSVGYGESDLDPNPAPSQADREVVSVLEFLRTSSPTKKMEKKERPTSQLVLKERKKGKPSKRKKSKYGNRVHESADDAMFRHDEPMFTPPHSSKSPKLKSPKTSKYSSMSTMSPAKTPKSPKSPKSPKPKSSSKSPALIPTFKESKRKRRTLSRKGVGARGQSEDDALMKEQWKDLESGSQEPQSVLLYSSERKKSSFSKLGAPTPEDHAEGGIEDPLPPPSRPSDQSSQPEYIYMDKGAREAREKPTFRRSSTRQMRKERKKDEGVQLENNDPLIYALFRRFNFKKK